ncbi:MAG: hypothetical protein KQ78_00093 [Candidatus Izimaplasma bacterium HR2]|nr:MAG: hypothetical protein KQ78_00093 [Candidatus Izimaplasma bacterium HR2]
MEIKDKVKGYLANPLKTSVRTKFLTLTEQAILINTLKNKVFFKLDGGYPNSELKRAVLYVDDEAFITCFKIKYNEKYLLLSHQNILGTLLSLSITKESIGDILASEDVFFITSELKEFIINEFIKINNVAITLEEIDGSNLVRNVELEMSSFTVSSLRLDSIVSKITKKSRNEALNMINNDLVKVNHLISNKNTKSIKEEDVISIRKYGRFIIKDTKNTSKKGKIIVKYGKYV